MKLAPLTLGLGVSMTFGYGALYYSFGVLAPEIAGHFGWSNSFVFSIFSLGLLGSAFLAPACGRLVDRVGARPVMSTGSAASAVLLAAHGLIDEPFLFVAVLALVPLISISVLYETGFTALTQRYGTAARPHMTAVTLIAGFASTIFWPLCQWLLSVTDWRGTYIAIGAVYAVGSLPVHLALPRGHVSKQEQATTAAMKPQASRLMSESERKRALLLMSATLAAAGFMISAMSTVLMVLLSGSGFSASAATLIGSSIGPAQVISRLVDYGLRGAMTPVATAMISSAATLLSVVALAAGQYWPSLAVGLVFGVLMGVGQGLNSIVRGVLPLYFFGAEGYGKLTGAMSFPRIVAAAAAPVSIVFIHDRFGMPMALMTLGSVAFIGLLTVIILGRVSARR